MTSDTLTRPTDYGLHLGKLPATADRRDLLAAKYLSVATGDKPPPVFGFDGFIPVTGWLMLGNDEVGDCAEAGPAHEHMLLTGGNHRANVMAQFTTSGVLSDYSRITGYDPRDPSSDRGSDVRDVLAFRRNTGIIDAMGNRHKITAYAALGAGDFDEAILATYQLGTIGIGIEFPDTAMDQFNNGEPWDVVNGARIVGGHYICGVGRARASTIEVITWGKRITMTKAFYAKYVDEAWAFLSPDHYLPGGRSLRGWDAPRMTADLAAL